MSHSGFILAWPVLERKYQSRKIPDPEKTRKKRWTEKGEDGAASCFSTDEC